MQLHSKKIKLFFVLFLLLLTSCSLNSNSIDNNERYNNLIKIINENESFLDSSNYFDIKVEMANINDGYRYYVTIDNAHSAMFNIEALAIEKEEYESNHMFANIGIFDELEYNMIPNQSYVEKGFVEGLIFSGVTNKPETTLYILVQWYNKDYSQQYREFFKLDTQYQELYGE